MLQINNITNDPRQTFILVGENQEHINFTLYYQPTQRGWFFDISYGSFSASGLRLSSSINALRQFRNLIPFGLLVLTEDGYEPYYLNDFESGRVTLYLLNANDVELIEENVFTFNANLLPTFIPSAQGFLLLTDGGFVLLASGGFIQL